jgi:hypothetical protein
MGAKAGNDACICNVLRISLRYANLTTLEDGYGINLVPLLSFALDTYADDPCTEFMPKCLKGNDIDERDKMQIARMHKAIVVIQFKMEAALFEKHKQWGMQDRELLKSIDYQRGVCTIDGKEYKMTSKGSQLICQACGKTYEMSEFGELKALEGETEFPHIPDWYEWERGNVRKEIEEGRYHFESICHVEALPNADKYIPIGKATLIHDEEGFHLQGNYQGEDYNYFWPAKTLYSCHIEYEYLGKKGDCVDLNLPNDTFYIYPECSEFSVTKLSLATEELHRFILRKQKENEE